MMQRTLGRLVLLSTLSTLSTLSIAGGASASSASTIVSPVDRAARAVVETLMDAWNGGDGEAFAAPFTEDATFRVWNGMFSEGRTQIAVGHQRIFDTFFSGTTLRLEIERVRRLGDEVALVYLRSHIMRGEEPVQHLAGMQGAAPVLVLFREAGEWRVAHFQNTPVVPPGG